MASASSVLKSIEEHFFECSYCLEYFKEPKQLPCLHRFCSVCLDCLIETHQAKGKFKCPLCNKTCTIPSDGIDGFKTDFHMKSMLQFIQLQHTVDREEVKECAGCGEERKVIAFCFKCTGFLCENCYNFHQTSRMVRDHLDKVLALKNAAANNITLEKLASLKEAPRCKEHPDKSSEICCATCGNVPICVLCGTLGKHKGHDLHDISELASKERDKLNQSLGVLETHEAKIYQAQEDIERMKAKLNKTVSTTKMQLESKYEVEVRKIDDQLKYNSVELERKKMEVDSAQEQELAYVEDMRKKQIEQAIQEINKEMDKLIVEKKGLHNKTRAQYQQKHDRREGQLLNGKEALGKIFNDSTLAVDSQGNERLQNMAGLLEQSKNNITRLENLKSSASHVLASHNNWTDIQCLPDITLASEAIVKDLGKPPDEVDVHPGDPLAQMPSFNAGKIVVIHRKTRIIDLGRMNKKLFMNNMTTLGHDKIVASGYISAQYAHVTTLDLSGQVLNQKILERMDGFRFTPNRYCAALSESEVIMASPPNVFGIYDLCRSKLTSKQWEWPAGRWVTCVASHLFNDRVFVGCNDRDIHMYDKELNDVRTLALPEVIEWPVDVAINDANSLYVCDQAGGEAYALSVNEAAITLIHKFAKPGSGLVPFSVCTDINGFVYMLWGKREPKCILAQYSENSNEILESREIEADSIALTSVLTDEVEKLLVITETTRRLQIYDLVSILFSR